MVTYFNLKDVIKFGSYLLSDERKESVIRTFTIMLEDRLTDEGLTGEDFEREYHLRFADYESRIEAALKEVSHASIANWLDSIGKGDHIVAV